LCLPGTHIWAELPLCAQRYNRERPLSKTPNFSFRELIILPISGNTGDKQNSIFISQILSIHPSAYTSLLLIVQSISPKGTEGIPLGGSRISLLFSRRTLLIYFLHAYLKSPLEK